MSTVDGSIESRQLDTNAVFTIAYRQHASSVLTYLRSQGVEDPEAVTQDTFVALYPRLAAITGGATGMRTLIFSIAHARVIDYRRHRSRVPAPLEYDPAADDRVTLSAEDHLVGGAAAASTLLAALIPEYRQVLALRVIADLSVEDTASIMDKTPGAIKQLQRRALVALRRQLTMDVKAAQ